MNTYEEIKLREMQKQTEQLKRIADSLEHFEKLIVPGRFGAEVFNNGGSISSTIIEMPEKYSR